MLNTKKNTAADTVKSVLKAVGLFAIAVLAAAAEAKTSPATNDLSTGTSFGRTSAYRSTRTEFTREVTVTWNQQTRQVVERLKGAISDAEQRGGAYLFVTNHYNGTATIKLAVKYCFFPEDLDATEAALNALELFKATPARV